MARLNDDKTAKIATRTLRGSRVQISLPANENYDERTEFRNPKREIFERKLRLK